MEPQYSHLPRPCMIPCCCLYRQALWSWLMSNWGAAPAELPSEEELVARVAAARAATAESEAHALDIRSRRIVADIMATAPAVRC